MVELVFAGAMRCENSRRVEWAASSSTRFAFWRARGKALQTASRARWPSWRWVMVRVNIQFRVTIFQARRLSVERNSYGNVAGSVAGWLAGWLSVTAGIVSKRQNISENFFDHLIAPSQKHSGPLTPIPNSKGNPFIGGVKYTGGWENWRFSFDFRRTSPNNF